MEPNQRLNQRSEIRGQESGVRGQKARGEPESHPPHGMSRGAVDETLRCKHPQGLTTAPSTAQVLELWGSGYRPDVTPPPYYGQRDNGCHEWERMPIFMAFLSAYPLSNRLANGTTDDLLGIHKKAVCVEAQCNPFSCSRDCAWRFATATSDPSPTCGGEGGSGCQFNLAAS
jgi:hypothetical protein